MLQKVITLIKKRTSDQRQILSWNKDKNPMGRKDEGKMLQTDAKLLFSFLKKAKQPKKIEYHNKGTNKSKEMQNDLKEKLKTDTEHNKK